MWLPCGWNVAEMWLTYGWPVADMWLTCGWHVSAMRLSEWVKKWLLERLSSYWNEDDIQWITNSNGRRPQMEEEQRILKKEYPSNYWSDLSQILNLSWEDQTKIENYLKWKWPPMDDNLNVLEWLDLPRISNLSWKDRTKLGLAVSVSTTFARSWGVSVLTPFKFLGLEESRSRHIYLVLKSLGVDNFCYLSLTYSLSIIYMKYQQYLTYIWSNYA